MVRIDVSCCRRIATCEIRLYHRVKDDPTLIQYHFCPLLSVSQINDSIVRVGFKSSFTISEKASLFPDVSALFFSCNFEAKIYSDSFRALLPVLSCPQQLDEKN